jgi:hypothetical protein
VLRLITDDDSTKQPVGYLANFMKQRHSLEAESGFASQKFTDFFGI